MLKSLLKNYIKDLNNTYQRGDAREESYYNDLDDLIKKLAEALQFKDIDVTQLPIQTEAGNPDFRVWDGKQHIVGYIEAKRPGSRLDDYEHTEQIKRYKSTFPNFILTNFTEFRLYRNGILIEQTFVCRSYIISQLKTTPPLENMDTFLKLLGKFFSFSLPKIYDARTLAIELAKRTKFLRDEIIQEEIKEEENNNYQLILGFYEAFKEYLIQSLTKKEFADLYSQTITYGLFAARLRTNGNFNRKLAYDKIPSTIGILKDVFQFISLGSLPTQMEWTIDDISEVLSVTDAKSILLEYFQKGRGEDPVIHFYETFLSEYDPRTRQKRGVYYTPVPVVSFINNSINVILKEHFNKADGIADKSVTLLDPAAGTLTFLAEAAKLAVTEAVSKYGEGVCEKIIQEHILENFYAFELMMAPYAIGHIKIAIYLEELGYKIKDNERVKYYLTNTLEMEELGQVKFPGMSSLSQESHLASKVKKEQPILVIFGNPPYSVSSVNKSAFIEKEMEVYKKDVRKERNIQPLSDDYIKFIRFAHWKIASHEQGIIGMITNNSYLSGLIHRGMRKELLKSFNMIYILNLHGNARIGEKCPDGGKDENVFDIMQGVSIALFIKNEKQQSPGQIYYKDLYGDQQSKYNYLSENSIQTVDWEEIKPITPHYFFVKKDYSLQSQYDKFLSVIKIFDKYSSGVKTHRDHFLVGFTKEEVLQRIRIFNSNLDDEIIKSSLNLKDTRDWNFKAAKRAIQDIDLEKYIKPYSYKPFDTRYICYHPILIDRGCVRWNTMKNFFMENIGFNLMRKLIPSNFTQILVSENIIDINFFAYQTYLFPLFIYIDSDGALFTQIQNKKSNMNKDFTKILLSKLPKTISTENIFYYIYTILYSNKYREKYQEFLKTDFPKIPFTGKCKLFEQVSQTGKRLADLHLLRSDELNITICKFLGKGDNLIKKVEYKETEERVCINDNQYFERIPREIWQYHIGSYQVCDKWLKDRRKLALSYDDIIHYCKVVTAIQETIEIQKQIDTLYPEIEKDIITFYK